MSVEITQTYDVLWLDDTHELSLPELANLSGLSARELQHLIECDALQSVIALGAAVLGNIAEARFSAHTLVLARTASRLRDDFDLDLNGLALTLRLLHRVHELEAELRHLRAQGR